MSDPKKMSPIVEQIASKPCRLCGGGEYSHFPELAFEHASGSSVHYFEVLVCRHCRRADMFAKLDILERSQEYEIVRSREAPPYR